MHDNIFVLGEAMNNHHELIQKIEMYLIANIHKECRVKEMGIYFKIDPANLDKLYRRATGMTIKQSHDKMKNELLHELLMSNGLKGYEIADKLGFEKEDTFYPWVKRMNGMGVRELREKLANEIKEIQQ
ncbi:MAG: helix-turn-helix transcriptional regulator [Ignavibacteriae bacterium]|nr:helix-turn-helix transcriptional regulator [Ignavibacteriota bacterium]